MSSDENNNNILDKLQDAIGRGQNPFSIFSLNDLEPETITISDPDSGTSGNFDFTFRRSLQFFAVYKCF